MKGHKPAELVWAERIIGLADRFGVLPSAVMDEDAEILRMLALLDPDLGKAQGPVD